MRDNVTNTPNKETINCTNTPHPSGISTVRPLCLYMTMLLTSHTQGLFLGEGAGGAHPPPPPEMTCSFLIQLVFCKKKNYEGYWC